MWFFQLAVFWCNCGVHRWQHPPPCKGRWPTAAATWEICFWTPLCIDFPCVPSFQTCSPVAVTLDGCGQCCGMVFGTCPLPPISCTAARCIVCESGKQHCGFHNGRRCHGLNSGFFGILNSGHTDILATCDDYYYPHHSDTVLPGHEQNWLTVGLVQSCIGATVKWWILM